MTRKSLKTLRFALSLAIVAAALLAAAPASASGSELSSRQRRKVADTVRAFDAFMATRDAEIPGDMIDGAVCIAVLPDVAKGALGVGGRYGKGLVSCRSAEGSTFGPWSPPSFIEIHGLSIGFQVGGQASDILMVVRNERGADSLMRDKFTLGADASVAAGPVGRTAGASTDLALQAGILVWARNRGLFAGAALDGATCTPDKTDNRDLYGRKVTMREILLPEEGKALPTPAGAEPWLAALAKHVR